MAALPLLKSSVVAFAAAFEIITTCVMSDGISGYGVAVLKRIVCGSTTTISLICLVNAVNGASWVSIHNGGGVGIGYSLHAGQVIVADGTDAAARRISRVLTSDPGMGELRHADAGYPEAITCAKERGVKIPGVTM